MRACVFGVVVISKRDKTESGQAVEAARREVIAKHWGVDLPDGRISTDLIGKLLSLGPRDPNEQLTLGELFESTDTSEYHVFALDTDLGTDDKSALSDLKSRVQLPIEYCQLENGKWCVRLRLPNSTPIAGIAESLTKAVKRIDIFLRLVPIWNAPWKSPIPRFTEPNSIPVLPKVHA